jgi:type II secretory pathway component PulF
MGTFHFQAIDRDGQPASGSVKAEGVEQAVALLRARGLTVHSIARGTFETAAGPDEISAPPSFSQVRPAVSKEPPHAEKNVEEAVLRAHMAAILERGKAIVPALRAYDAEAPTAWRRRQLGQLCRILECGDPGEATRALVECPESWIPLLSASATASDPGEVLEKFLNDSRVADVLRQQWWLTLAYPIVLLCLATAVMTLLAIFVIPEFRAIFTEFDLMLPSLSSAVLTVGSFLSRAGVPIVVLLVVLLAIVYLTASRLLPAPISIRLGNRLSLPLGRRLSVARMARFVADLLEAGVSIPDALRIAGFTVNRPRMRKAAWQLANDIETTGGFSQSNYRRPLTASVTYALAADVPNESRVQLLREISSAHADRTRIHLSWATGIVEPLAIFVVGVVVAFVVIGLFLPLVKLIEGLSA